MKHRTNRNQNEYVETLKPFSLSVKQMYGYFGFKPQYMCMAV